jgi:glycosyltransferase involved in cell wall biosynthesis
VFWAGRTLHPRLGRRVRTISTVHDLNHVLVPETMQLSTRLSHQLWFEPDVRHADVVVANSQGTADRLRERYQLSAAAVIRPGLAKRFAPSTDDAHDVGELRALGVRPPYLLTVATLEPRKNVESTFRAFMELRQSGQLSHHQLVLAGANGWQNQALDRAIEDACHLGVVRTGYVPNALLPTLYAHADAVLVPSLYEGFGMPALEARACGARVIVSDVPELREAAGSEAIVVAPTVAGIRDGIVRAVAGAPMPEPAAFEWLEHSWALGAKQLKDLIATTVNG